MKHNRQLMIVRRQPTNWLQRSTACWLQFFVCLERVLSPNGHLRRWLIQNARLGAWLFIPASIVMPFIGLILWQVTSWYDMITGIFGHFVALPVLFLMVFIIVRSTTASFRR